MNMLDAERFDAMTFDCYGTLIDWESGLLAALRPVLASHGVVRPDDSLLKSYASHESALESGPYLPYREVLAGSLRALAADAGFTPTNAELESFSHAPVDWPAFHDTPAALAALKRRFTLGVITNCDDDLFAASNQRLGVDFDVIVTAQQARAYKPAHAMFELAFERLRVPRDRILHVAQSLYHDHVPAKQLGLTTVWINRRQGRAGSGATPPASSTPDLTLPDMASLADVATTT